jgi:predicted GTPase
MADNIGLKDLIADFQRMKERFEKAEVRIGIIGESGTGKSSLINRIFGKYVAPVGVVEQTSEPTPYTKDGLIFVDLPGAGTQRWPIETYVARLSLLTAYDAFVLVTRGRVMINDVHLYAELCQAGKHVFVVRNQFDSALAGEHCKPAAQQATVEQLRHTIVEDLSRQLSTPALRVYLTCAHPGHQSFDLEALVGDISEALDDIKRVRFIAQAAVLGKETLEAKQQAAAKIVSYYAIAAAANGINPIPGIDIAVDVGILITMSKSIVSCYGLMEDQVEWAAAGRANIVAMGRKLATQFSEYFIRDAMLKILGRLAAQEGAKTIAKWIPIIGQLIAAGIGYKIAIGFGNRLVDECHEAAMKLLDAAQRDIARD